MSQTDQQRRGDHRRRPTPLRGTPTLRFYGRWGGAQGFKPVYQSDEVTERAAYELRRVLRRLLEQKRREEAERRGLRYRKGVGRSRGRDGLTVFGVDGHKLGPILIEWAEQTAMVKALEAPDDREFHWRWDRRVLLRAFPELDLGKRDDPEALYAAHLEQQAAAEAAEEELIERYLAGEL